MEASSASSAQRCIEDAVALERVNGESGRASQLATASLAKYPTSSFLRNELSILGHPDSHLYQHLAADSNRILDLVVQYNRLGLYSDSLTLLSKQYPGVAPLQREPGAPTPEQNPLIAYYRGYCHERLGQSGDADYQAASRMPLRYIFPSRAETIPVLRAALSSNPSDASAHFLLGDLWFSKGMTEPALDEWRRAASLQPDIPSLDASLGKALLEIKHQPAEAEAVFEQGFQADPSNSILYVEMDKAMQQMGRSASQRVAMLQRFPQNADMPAELVRALVNALREDGKDDEADALLAKHFLPRKEGSAPLAPVAKGKPDTSPVTKN
jgi:tetratricopeptide (TPR) repeat protein